MDLFVDSRLGEETECLVDNRGEINFEREFFKKLQIQLFLEISMIHTFIVKWMKNLIKISLENAV